MSIRGWKIQGLSDRCWKSNIEAVRVKRQVALEQFYTCRELAKGCVAAVVERYELGSFDLIVEPSAGDGAFFHLLPESRRLGLDLAPQGTGILEQDFFEWEPAEGSAEILMIGNPLFGQRGKLAVAFLNRACRFSRVVAFILPRSFRKDTFMNRVDRDFHLVGQFDCSAFRSPSGGEMSIKAVFQIWERGEEARPMIRRETSHQDFELKHAHLSRTSPAELARIRENYDFAIPQVGSKFKPRRIDGLDSGSHWFVKIRKPAAAEIFEDLDFSFLDGLNLSFTSLSKKDIIQAYREARTRAAGS